MSLALHGSERTWDGTGRSSAWSEIGNWVGGIAPLAGDSLRFPTSTDLAIVNDYSANTDFSLITFASAGYNVTGNAIDLSGGIAVTHASGSTIFSLPVTLLANQTVSVTQVGATLFLNGEIQMGTRNNLTFDVTGQVVVVGDIANDRLGITSQLRKQGTGLLWMLQPASYSAPTLINGGTLRVDGRATNTFITINSSGTLRGAGRIGAFRAASGGTVQPGFNNTDVLDAFGDVEMSAGSSFAVRLNGTTADSAYDRLNVRGTVTLGGTLNVTARFVPAVGDTFTIIENDGEDEVIGTFSGLPEGTEFMVNGRPFKISYGGRGLGGIIGRDNDVTLEAVPALAIWDGGGTNDNRWSQPLNWVGDTLPWDGDDLQFTSPTNAPAMITRNDLPASRFFGSIFFGYGTHRIEGDPVDLRGRIETTTGGSFVDIRVPLTLRGGVRHNFAFGNVTLRAPVTLSAGQTFLIGQTNASLAVTTILNLAGHQLTVHTLGTAGIQDVGPGTLFKTGAGRLRISGTIFADTTVEAGTFELNGASFGPIAVNTGGVFRAEGAFYDLEVEAGGVFEPGIATSVHGTVRLREGSTFHVVIAEHSLPSGTVVTSTGFAYDTNADVLLENPDLRITIADTFSSGQGFPVIRRTEMDTPHISGTFRDLPEGSLTTGNNRGFSISYTNGVKLLADPNIVWDGGGTGGNWSRTQNWMPDFVPVDRMGMSFPAVTKRTMTNDLPLGTTFSSLSFTADSYALYGSPIGIQDSIGATITSNQVNVYLDIYTDAGDNVFLIPVNASGTLNLEGAITGNVELWKEGEGTLRLSGSKNNFQEELWIRFGRLELAKVGATAVSESLRLGHVSATVVATFFADNQISDFANVTVHGDAGGSRLDLNGYSDAIGSLNGSGIIDFRGRGVRSGRLSVAGGTFGGNFVGEGTFVKIAAPAGFIANLLTLDGVNTFSGNTIVNGGELRVEGSFANSPIRLDGGTLSGRGYVSTITANLGGTLAPGFGGTALNVALHSGNVDLNAATTFRTLLTSPTVGLESHKLNVTGTINLGGCALTVDLFQTFLPAQGLRFVIIENDGVDSIVGTFNGVPEGGWIVGDGFAFTVSYVGGDGNDVQITRTKLPPSTLSPIVLVTPEHVTIRGEGVDGVRYYIEGTPDLTPPTIWQVAGFATANSNGVFELTYPPNPLDPNPPRFFYRVANP